MRVCNITAARRRVLSSPKTYAVYSYVRRTGRLITTITRTYIEPNGSAISLILRRSSAIMSSSNCNIYISSTTSRTSVIVCASAKIATPTSCSGNASTDFPSISAGIYFMVKVPEYGPAPPLPGIKGI